MAGFGDGWQDCQTAQIVPPTTISFFTRFEVADAKSRPSAALMVHCALGTAAVGREAREGACSVRLLVAVPQPPCCIEDRPTETDRQAEYSYVSTIETQRVSVSGDDGRLEVLLLRERERERGRATD